MLPIIFSIGQITIHTLGFLMAVGFFLSGFIVWRRLREQGIDEEKAIDFLLLFYLLGLVFSRSGYILGHFDKFGLNFGRWLALGKYPGLSLLSMLAGMIFALVWFVRNNRWHLGRIADEVTFGAFPLLILLQIGFFFDGSWLGLATSMPWGMFLPGDLIRRHPVSLYGTVLTFLIWVSVIWLERRWRTWEFCRRQGEGFVALISLLFFSLTHLIIAFLEPGGLYYLWLKRAGAFLGFMAAFLILTWRSLSGSKRGNVSVSKIKEK